jgi:hypothetical protein
MRRTNDPELCDDRPMRRPYFALLLAISASTILACSSADFETAGAGDAETGDDTGIGGDDTSVDDTGRDTQPTDTGHDGPGTDTNDSTIVPDVVGGDGDATTTDAIGEVISSDADAGDAIATCDVPNGCGGCKHLDHDPATTCGECGKYTCSGPDSTTCTDPGKNACGGCTILAGKPGDTCCGGTLSCNGTDALKCSGSGNACGGCGTLTPPPGSTSTHPGDPCGKCNTGTIVCNGVDALRCDDPLATAPTPGSTCSACGTYQCNTPTGATAVVCASPDPSACAAAPYTCEDKTCTITSTTSSVCGYPTNNTKCPPPYACFDSSCTPSPATAPSGCLNTPNNSKCTGAPTCFDATCVGSGGDSSGCNYAADAAKCTAKPSCYDRSCLATGGDATTGCKYTENDTHCTTPPYGCFVGACTGTTGDGCNYGAPAGGISSACDDGYACTADTCIGACTPPDGYTVCNAYGASTATGCQHAMIDADGDHYSPYKSCLLSIDKTNADCDDGDSRVHPGATYQSTGMTGTYVATLTSSGTSDCTTGTTLCYDYNCNGITELKYGVVSCKGTGASCTVNVAGFSSATACGVTGTYVSACVWTGTVCVPDVSGSGFSQVQVCR